MSKITDEVTRPIIGIENRTGQEVFDIMADRFRALRSKSEAVGVPTVADVMAQLDAAIEAENRHHARRNEMLATLIANIEKSEPTPEFAIALREYVRTERPKLTHPAPATVVSDATFQSRVADAHVALFHDDPTDLPERRDRFYEEATETAQALGMTEADAHALVAYTFSRPVGEPTKEIGAAALTLASLCVEGGWDMMACAEADLAVLVTPEKIAKVRAKRSTRHGRGTLPGIVAALTEEGA